ncbi:unnamed protein product [Protopolystoma xenopodis]|uniref:Uncharacterized protein n=1 Tax=Protopolystoma xenopodis TaxID=117903 RepID=A0A448X5R1_9PLAT|nr:unnamed protein product [Protopolystoma xenopodis]
MLGTMMHALQRVGSARRQSNTSHSIVSSAPVTTSTTAAKLATEAATATKLQPNESVQMTNPSSSAKVTTTNSTFNDATASTTANGRVGKSASLVPSGKVRTSLIRATPLPAQPLPDFTISPPSPVGEENSVYNILSFA